MKISQVEIGEKEIPGYTSLIIYFSGCPIHCPDCHSKDFWDADIGIEYTQTMFENLLSKHKNICDCVCFMGGEWNSSKLYEYANSCNYYNYSTALYTGLKFDKLDENMIFMFDFIKTGCYDKSLGGLDKKTTNQRLWEISYSYIHNNYKKDDITYLFWE